MNKDARVAEIIGENVRQLKSGEWQYEVKDGLFTTWYPVLPYITNPNHALDGIVLEWVQGNEVFDDWETNLRSLHLIRAKMMDTFEMPISWLVLFLEQYKPGDYAQALLAVEEERNE